MPDALSHVPDEDLFAEVRARLSRAPQPPSGDWIDAYERGEVLLTDEAATVADVSADTIRRWCSAGADSGEVLGVLIAGTAWLVSLARLLGSIERRRGRPERVIAEQRAKKMQDCGRDRHFCCHACTRKPPAC